MTSANPNYLPKVPSPNTITLKVRLRHVNLEGMQFIPQQKDIQVWVGLTGEDNPTQGDKATKGSVRQKSSHC